MKHPALADLALYACGDLAWPRRVALRVHLQGCPACRHEAARFAESTAALRQSALDIPEEVDWDRLSLEMKANIRLGLEAGECVRATPVAPSVTRWRIATAAVSMAALLIVAGMWKVYWTPDVAVPVAESVKLPPEVVLKATLGGIGVEKEGSAFALAHEGKAVVTISAGMHGSLRAGYVDEDTGQVTIHHVYVE